MPDFNFEKYDSAVWALNETRADFVRNLIYNLIRELSAVTAGVKLKGNVPFSFSDYPKLQDRANKAFKKFAGELQKTIELGNQTAWSSAYNKNDALVDFISKNTGLSKGLLDLFDPQNSNALAAFQKRKSNGLTLSDRVWTITQQAKSEVEMALSVGLGQGKSADQLSRSVRQYLNEPERLFRRVRDVHGQLQLSKNAKAYKPGQGVYRSSYKNALRLTRTENNMAYREADFERWNELTFVVGIEVRLSNNPNHCPTCEQLKGKYPKEFKFVGWHPQCRCFAIPILNTSKEFAELSQAESKNKIVNVPPGFNRWIESNKERIAKWKNTPYFIKDNFKAGDVTKGFSF